MPTVSIDNELVAVTAIGIPGGLGIHLASADPHSTPPATGVITTTVDAIIGAWLGFHVAAGFLAVFTTTIGATLAANVTASSSTWPGSRSALGRQRI
jgi:hypothetical protein